jgi:soluble lytic murein transglycosylase
MATTRTSRTSRRSAARRRATLRRRLFALAGVAALVVLAITVVGPVFHHAVKEVVLPLRHEDIIRQQARAKDLDPALVAGVIYTESRFRDQTSRAGAKGLMQLTPATAKFIEDLSGGSTFQLSDLSTPQVNIAYGTFYLRYLMNRYGGNESLALAAYNGGEGNVDRWVDEARREGKALSIDAIPFGETRAYVRAVQSAAQQYRKNYRAELGL